MTIKQIARKKKGIQTENINPDQRRFTTYDIDFINPDGETDETQFDAENIEELDQLFTDFCKENGFKRNTVVSITIVA